MWCYRHLLAHAGTCSGGSHERAASPSAPMAGSPARPAAPVFAGLQAAGHMHLALHTTHDLHMVLAEQALRIRSCCAAHVQMEKLPIVSVCHLY